MSHPLGAQLLDRIQTELAEADVEIGFNLVDLAEGRIPRGRCQRSFADAGGRRGSAKGSQSALVSAWDQQEHALPAVSRRATKND